VQRRLLFPALRAVDCQRRFAARRALCRWQLDALRTVLEHYPGPALPRSCWMALHGSLTKHVIRHGGGRGLAAFLQAAPLGGPPVDAAGVGALEIDRCFG